MSENSISSEKMWMIRDFFKKNLPDIVLYVTVCSESVIFFRQEGLVCGGQG